MTAYEHNNWDVKFILFYLYLTVRGMMYYRKAIKLQAFLDMAEDDGAFYHWLRLFYHYDHGDFRLSRNLVQHLLNLISIDWHFFFFFFLHLKNNLKMFNLFNLSTRYSPRLWCHREGEWYFISSTWCNCRHEIYTYYFLSNVWIT